MSDRIQLSDQEMEDVVGGALRWKNGEVWPKNDPSCVYEYFDYGACKAWIVNNWNDTQDERTLEAMASQGLVRKKTN